MRIPAEMEWRQRVWRGREYGGKTSVGLRHLSPTPVVNDVHNTSRKGRQSQKTPPNFAWNIQQDHRAPRGKGEGGV